MCLRYNRLIGITIYIIFFSINWKNYVYQSIGAISMTVLKRPNDYGDILGLVIVIAVKDGYEYFKPSKDAG